VTVTAIQESEGSTVGWRWLLRDIRDRKRVQEALQQLNGELEGRVRERTAELECANARLRVEIAQHQQTLQALRESQAALSQREQEFKALVEHAPDVIERFDRNLRHVYVNPAIERATGKLPAEFIGKTNRELAMPESKTLLWEKALKRVFQTAQEAQIEFSCPSPSGQRYYQTRLVPEFATSGTAAGESGFVETVLGISRDISQRKQTEEALWESAERFRQLAENIREVFWLVIPDRTQLLYVSPAYEEIWGRTCQSLYEQPLSWLDAVHPDDRDRCFATLDEFKREEWDMEYRILRGDGSVRWIRDRCFAIRDEGGCVYRIAGIAEDITERKRAEEEVMKALEAERELNQLKSSFVAMTSHEFRTPLTAIQASAEMLERYRQRLPEEKQRNHFHRIGAAVERMTDMLEDVLVLSQAEAGKLEFQPAPLDLGQFCRSLVEDLRANAKNQQEIVLTEREIAPPEVPPQMDEKLLRHILSNLLSNSLKYSPAESTVEFELICDRDRAYFRIRDRGIGIPPHDLAHLFESFRRATNVGNIQGTGLGLAIVKRCVDLHGGEIQVESEVGCGTTFTVTLPLNCP
jgi:PAS domain S-box-containing protein